jgi:choline dehydrogenase-like flavoprotein
MWQFSPPTRFGTKYKDAVINAKNIHLYTYANVVNIATNENISFAKEVTIKNYTGKQHTVKAKYFVMACCSIQNARLLLASNKQAKKGLGNDNDIVGRYFMEHPQFKSGELWLKESNPYDLYKVEKGTKVRAELSVSPEKQKELKVLNGTISLMPLEFSKNKISSIKMWSNDDPRKSLDSLKKYYTLDKRNFFERHFMTSKIFKAYGLITTMEQAPNPQSRVLLSNEKDSLGVPRANLDWKMCAIDKQTVRKINQLLGQQVGQAGIGRVKLADFLLDEKDDSMPEYISGGWHHIGTTRMSDNPKEGVVDADCKVHGISNLFITGASCFPTGGAVNPTYTTVAMTLRLSDHLKEQMKNAFV